MKKFSELNKINESSPDYEFQNKVEKTNAYKNLSSKLQAAIDVFKSELGDEIGYDEGSSDDDRAVSLAIQSAMDSHYGY